MHRMQAIHSSSFQMPPIWRNRLHGHFCAHSPHFTHVFSFTKMGLSPCRSLYGRQPGSRGLSVSPAFIFSAAALEKRRISFQSRLSGRPCPKMCIILCSADTAHPQLPGIHSFSTLSASSSRASSKPGFQRLLRQWPAFAPMNMRKPFGRCLRNSSSIAWSRKYADILFPNLHLFHRFFTQVNNRFFVAECFGNSLSNSPARPC